MSNGYTNINNHGLELLSYPIAKLKSSLRQFYSLHHDMINRDGISVSRMTTVMFILS